MNKVLLGSTALVAAGMLVGSGVPAQGAEPITLSVGGYYYAFAGFRAQSDVDNQGVGAGQTTIGNDEDMQTAFVDLEGEIQFTGSTTLDNGITVGVNVQLEAYASGDQVDEHFVFFSGNFGRLVIGAENSAAYLMHYGPPGAAQYHGVDSPGMWHLLGTSGNTAGGSTGSPVATPVGFTSDANKVTYFTPRFSPGFQFGFSYTPDITDVSKGGSGNAVKADSEDLGQENIVEFGMNFVRAFGDVDFAWSFGYAHGFVEGNGTGPGVNCNQPGNPGSAPVCVTDPDNQQGRDQLSTGFQIGVGGWKVGGAFGLDDQGQEGDNKEYEASAGVSYGAGPWTVGAQGAFGLDKDGGDNVNPNPGFDSDKVLAGEISGKYTLGPGVAISAGVQGWRGWGDDGNENFDGVAFFMGTGLSF
jgi:outer membrane protein OmpU